MFLLGLVDSLPPFHFDRWDTLDTQTSNFCFQVRDFWANVEPPGAHQLTPVASEIEGANKNLNQIYCQLHKLEHLKDAPRPREGSSASEDRGAMLGVRPSLGIMFT